MDELMDYDGFLEYVIRETGKAAKEEGLGEVALTCIAKNNNVKTDVLRLRSDGMKPEPAISLERYYGRYSHGMSAEEIVAVILEIFRDQVYSGPVVDDTIVTDFEKAGEKLLLRAVNYERNRERLEDCPYVRILDIALTINIVVQSGSITSMCQVTNSLMELWGKQQPELYRMALENTKRRWEPCIIPLDAVIGEMAYRMEEEGKPPVLSEEERKAVERSGSSLFMLSNQIRTNGAVMMFITDRIAGFAEQTNRDIYILPSSIHEVILYPTNKKDIGEDLHRMVVEINGSVLDDEEFLSDHVYHYSRETGRIVIEA